VGGGASLVERKNRHERHFLLREQPVARARVAAADLTAICVWEGWNDAYRESARHGGIICSFRKNWQTCR